MTPLELDPGLTLLRTDSPRSGAIHHIAGAHLADAHAAPTRPAPVDGEATAASSTTDGSVAPSTTGASVATGSTAVTAYWIDARNVASTHALYGATPSGRALAGLRVARAFTAYQHHALVERAARRVDGDTALVVAPNVGALYRDDDLPAWEREDLLTAAVERLAAVGRAHGVPVLVSTAHESTADALSGYADADCTVVRTREGIRIAGDGAPDPTAGYRGPGYWQTTIPYWVELLGAVEAFVRDPAIAAADRGLVDAAQAVLASPGPSVGGAGDGSEAGAAEGDGTGRPVGAG